MIILQTVGLLGRVISSSQLLYLNTEQHIYTHSIPALSWIRTHDPGFRASDENTSLTLLGYRDRLRGTFSVYTRKVEVYFKNESSIFSPTILVRIYHSAWRQLSGDCFLNIRSRENFKYFARNKINFCPFGVNIFLLSALLGPSGLYWNAVSVVS
jgi:hypothetical protein